MRRVVTGKRNGKSVILDDVEIPGQEILGSEGFELWETIGIPTLPIKDGDLKKQLTFKIRAEETRVRLGVFPPYKEWLKKGKEKGIDLEEQWRKLFGDDLLMHTTDTIDYAIVLSGEVWMEVDDSVEVHLKPFDCVVQNGTRHGWRNKSSKNCLMLFVLIGAKRKKST